ncbi:UNVERIFIED_CONTAM: hypothetical protein PYX00_005424 [Menopon gallinae]|uniref:Uncharacterized protein n=1 Tax=Menopon gallinae TaxID=328185 RepID=A0AAW2HS38_9NEOP
MWRIWFFFGILEISFGAPVKTNQGEGAPSSELFVLNCLLSSPLNSCDDVKRTVEKIPKRIQKLYEKLKKPIKDITNNELLDTDALDSIPISLLYLIPKIRLHSMSGLMASNIVRKYPLDDALTMKILGLLTDDTKVQDFLDGLSKYDDPVLENDYDSYEDDAPVLDIPFISPAVEEEVGIALSKWFPNGSHWQFWLFQKSMMSGTPILANLPNYFLENLPLKTTEKFLYHLRNWRWDRNYPSVYDDFSSSASLWTRHTMAIRRVWAHVVLTKAEEPGRWSSRMLNQLGFLLTGATPDELKNLPTSLRFSQNSHILLQLDWSPLQARSVFDVLYSDLNELNGNDLNNLKNMVVNLLPRQLQQFSENATNFEPIMKSDDKISLATKKQMLELQIAHKVLKNHTKGVEPIQWKHKISSLGKFVHIVPASRLQVFENESFSLQTLGKIDSSYLTYRQIRYLTKSGGVADFNLLQEEAILSLKSFLKSVPSVTLTNVNANKLFQSVKEHLLMFTSGDSLSSMAAILAKIRSSFADISFLEKMLYHREYQQYFNLLGSRDITRNFKNISNNLFILVNKDANLERNIRLLPYNTLFALLSKHRQDVLASEGSWTYENLIDSSLKMYISGLSCSDIQHLEMADFMPVIGYYVRHRRALGQVFPKNMQHCGKNALMHYLKMKAQLRDMKYEPNGILHLLESYEVKAVGGYILSGLPVNMIISTSRKQQIISEIGKLTIPELLTATSFENLKHLANSFYEEPTQYQLKAISALGNLVWFLSDENIRRVNAADFKIFLESQEEISNRALCLSEAERNSWRLFLVNVYGNPEVWSPGNLKELGDLLMVFDNYELGRINRTSWAEAADVLAQSASYFSLMEWPGKPQPVHLYEVCLEVLEVPERPSFRTSVKNLHRLYLEAAQYLLDTVVPSPQLLKLDEKNKVFKGDESMGKLHFTPTLLENDERNNTSEIRQSVVSDNIGANVTSETETKLGDVDNVTMSEPLSETSSSTEVPAKVNSKTDPGVYSTTEDLFEDGSFSDMVQGDQEFGEKDDYDYESDYPAYREYDEVEEPDQSPVTPALSEAEATERLKKMLLSPLNIFKIFSNNNNNNNNDNDNGGSSSQASSKAKRSVDGVSEQNSPEERTISGYKSVEEKKEELRLHGSRDLVIEVPVNTSDKLRFDCPSKKDIKITCDAIRILGKSASLVLDEEDIKNMSDVELEDCSEVLGSLDLDKDLRVVIWKRLKEWKQSGNLLEVGNLVSAIEEDELPDIVLDLSQPWGYENLHTLSKHISDPFLMSQAADEFLTKNTNLTTLSYESATALGPLICTMTLAHQRKLLLSQSHVFVDVAPVLGNSIKCENKIFESCMYHLALISTSEEAFGKTQKWDASDVSTLGTIVAGLPKEDLNDGKGNGLRPEAFEGLTPEALSCMPSDSLKVLSEEQLSHIPAMTVAVLSPTQRSILSPSQSAVLDRFLLETPENFESTISGSASQPKTTYTIYLSVTIYAIYYFFPFRTFS